ncbi:Gfo/Idh/MocA family oxidoreductase, partial [Pseudomonas sp. BGM005]|nr:Gfo/Idh/MocA family oxidoreductase [Pseudomonas sp. BG5]
AFAAEALFDRGYGSVETLLSDPEIDVVHIGTPHGTHHALALEVLSAGKHVVVEKPIGLNRAEVADIRDTARAAGLFAMEGMWMKFNRSYRRMLADVQSHVIGEPRSVRASFGVPFPADVGSRWSAELGGSTLLDQGIYAVTIALDVFGTPTEIIARGRMRPDGVDLSEHVTLEFSDSRYAQIAASMVEFCELTATVNGTRGWIA